MHRILILLIFGTIPVSAACHAVGPAATGSTLGTNFSNLMAVPSSTAWVRGDTYYFIAGTYPSKLQLGTANSSTTVITLLRATNADHGVACGIGTGYVDATMGQPAGSATIPLVEILSGYWNLDGLYPNANTGTAFGYGFYTDGAVCGAGDCWEININNGGTWDHITVKNWEVLGRGDAVTDNPARDDLVRIAPTGTISTFTFQYLYLHNSSSTCWKINNSDNVTLNNNTCEHNHATSANHSEPISAAGGAHWVVAFNTFKDVEGTGGIVQLNSGSAQTADDWLIYGNLFYVRPGNPAGRSSMGNGILSCINDNTWTNIKYINNTVANMPGNTGMHMLSGAGECTSNAGLIVKNNLWYNNTVANSATSSSQSGYAGFDYNSYLNTPMTSGDAGGNTIVNGSAANPFVNTTQVSPTDYKLAANTNVTPWTNTNASVPTNATDYFGVTRSLSRGFAEFVSGGGGNTPAPGGLVISMLRREQ